MKKSPKSRKWKSLSLKIQHLQLELEEREELLKKYEEDFLKELFSLETDELVEKQKCEDIKHSIKTNHEHLTDDAQIIDAPPPAEGPEEMKQLWRMIAIATHPDKTQGDEEKSDFYKMANEAWRMGNYNELYKIALALDIEPPDTVTTYTTLEEITSDLEKKISEKEKSILWEWGKSQGEMRQKIFDVYLASKGKKRKK